MITPSETKLRDLVLLFESGANQTRGLVDQIEGLVIELYLDEPWFDDLSEALSLYLPNDEPGYVNARFLLVELQPIMSLIGRSTSPNVEDCPLI
jgi:hypothetical protein